MSANSGPRSLQADFWWLWSAKLVIWMGRFVVPFMTIFLTKVIGLNSVRAGWVVSGYGIGIACSSLISGALGDFFGRRRILLLSMILSAAMLIVIPSVTSSIMWVTVSVVLYGLVSGSIDPLILTLTSDIVPIEHRVMAFSYNNLAMNLGYAIGPIVAGLVPLRFFMFLFYGQAGAVIISFFLVAYKVNIDETYLRIEETKGDAAKPDSFAAVFRDRAFLFLVLMMGLEFVVYSQTTTTLPLVMTAQGYPTWKYSLILTLNGGMLCLLQVPAARLLTRQHRGLIFVCCLVLEGIGFGMQAFADYYWIYIVAAITWTLGELGSHPAAQSIVPDIAPVRLRGRYQGVYSMSWSIAMIVSPTLGGLVLNAWGPKVLWLMGGLILFVVSLMAVVNNKRIERSVNALWEQQMSFMQRS